MARAFDAKATQDGLLHVFFPSIFCDASDSKDQANDLTLEMRRAYWGVPTSVDKEKDTQTSRAIGEREMSAWWEQWQQDLSAEEENDGEEWRSAERVGKRRKTIQIQR